ncbi:MAG: alpha-amylase family glycosyl hydrolase [Myxococcales bacterium]|nr:alpha-amylase family glycosyl hydrolase [Myxococcota bacterium]MDW8282388.1 alpha-amylase family glycosyl hydrolase [Myxococcales bacterium]
MSCLLRIVPWMGMLWLTGCAAAPSGVALEERCQLVVWYRPDRALAEHRDLTPEQADRPELIGSWNAWRRPGLRAWERRRSEGGSEWRVLALPLPPGVYHYGIVVGERLVLDARNPQTAFQPSPLRTGDAPYATEVSRAVLPDCSVPAVVVREVAAAAGSLRLEADVLPGSAPVRPEGITAELWRGSEPLAAPEVRVGEAGALTVVARGLPAGKYTVRIRVRDEAGGEPPPTRASVFVEPDGRPGPPPLGDGLVYHLLVDRFWGAGPLAPPATPGRRAGGTLHGVRAMLEAGYFDRLGVTTLWLSPLYQNPPGLYTGRDGRPYEAYHGYWPAAPRSVEPHLGGEEALEALMRAAHARGLRVIADAVPNHVHDSHPYYRHHSRQAEAVRQAPNPAAASWFHDGPGACVCGTRGCGWGERLEDCWFDRYLPDLNWRHPEVLDAGVEDLLHWTERFDLDGFRIDAVPMMPRAATRRIARALRQGFHRKGLDGLLLGETFTGPGDWGRAEIRAFLGQRHDGLDSQFDFPLMWAIRDVLAAGRRNLIALEEEIAASDRAFAGSGAAMAHILGNHDTPRFISEATGEAGGDPWLHPPPQPVHHEPYRRQLLGLALILTLPGLPVLYYGDEVGLAGAGDPDNRRVLPDVLGGALAPPQAWLLEQVGRLGRLRRCLPVLRRGVRRPVLVQAEHVVAVHEPVDAALDAPAISVLSRAPAPALLSARGLPPGRYLDALSHRPLTIPAGADAVAVEAAALSVAIYVPAHSPCLEPLQREERR